MRTDSSSCSCSSGALNHCGGASDHGGILRGVDGIQIRIARIDSVKYARYSFSCCEKHKEVSISRA